MIFSKTDSHGNAAQMTYPLPDDIAAQWSRKIKDERLKRRRAQSEIGYTFEGTKRLKVTESYRSPRFHHPKKNVPATKRENADPNL